MKRRNPLEPADSERAEAQRRRSLSMHEVEEDYEVVDGGLRPTETRSGEGRRYYFPMAAPAILGDFVRMRIGDEASLLTFARRWGLLGYHNLTWLDTSWLDSQAQGEPVAWIWAHLSGIQTALRLWGFWRHDDDAALTDFLRRRPASEEATHDLPTVDRLLKQRDFGAAQLVIERHCATPSADARGDPDSLIVVSADGPRVTPYSFDVRSPSGPPWSQAWNIVRRVINPNLSGVHPEINLWASRSPAAPLVVQGWDTIMSVIYRHLFEVIASGEVEECRECSTPFVRTDGRQRFCPPPPWSREGQCAMRFHKREQRRRKAETREAQ